LFQKIPNFFFQTTFFGHHKKNFESTLIVVALFPFFSLFFARKCGLELFKVTCHLIDHSENDKQIPG